MKTVKQRKILGIIYLIEVRRGDIWTRHQKIHEALHLARPVKYMLEANGAEEVRIVKITTEEINCTPVRS